MNELILGTHNRFWPSRDMLKRLLWDAAGAVALGGLYGGRISEHWLRIERRDMPIANLEKGLEGTTLAHISDLHCSPIVLERYLRQCVEIINRMEVDFVAITGDFITGPAHYARRIGRILRDLHANIATVACLGNHDYGLFHPAGLGGTPRLAEYVAEQLSHADVFVMLNEVRRFSRNGATMQFVGMEDVWSERYNPALAFESAHSHLPTIALCHNPDGAETAVDCGANWVLAGHTHGTPPPKKRLNSKLLPSSHRHFSAGEYHLGDGRYLYVNRGLGYGRRRNLNARPEITLFTLQNADIPNVVTPDESLAKRTRPKILTIS